MSTSGNGHIHRGGVVGRNYLLREGDIEQGRDLPDLVDRHAFGAIDCDAAGQLAPEALCQDLCVEGFGGQVDLPWASVATPIELHCAAVKSA